MRVDRAPARRRDEAGAGILELLIVVAIVGILANITVPLLLYAVKRAQAQSIINDFLVVQQAAIQYDLSNFIFINRRACKFNLTQRK